VLCTALPLPNPNKKISYLKKKGFFLTLSFFFRRKKGKRKEGFLLTPLRGGKGVKRFFEKKISG
jgi:hypothetical protein